jgi:type I restriction enzyme R subunit
MTTHIHTEGTFEAAIEASLIEDGGYVKGNSNDFDPVLGVFPNYIIEFIRTSQPKAWEKITSIHKDDVERKLVNALLRELETRGTLNVLRKGFTNYGVKFKMAFFRPESTLNPDAEELYRSNHLSVTRQVYYQKLGRNSLDMVLALNGLPLVTIELKNQFTGQTIKNAEHQYRYDRDSGEMIFRFKQRSLVHFALDTDEASMTTRLAGSKTRYLPFNRGHNNGAGNPSNDDGYRTSYLWEDIWAKDSLMDIVEKFLHLQVEEYEENGRKKLKETMIFPRFHQLEVVRKLTKHAKEFGAGQNYLVQHSAGSGKSNSIAWLSYRLSSLHDVENNRIFDSVIVITDRRVLDSQLQDTIYQFEHKDGVVRKIDKDSQQLADAITTGANIIITTLQKFPFVLDKIGELPNRKYAVVIDEAHSSQGGEASKKLKEVLSAKSLEEAEKEEMDSGLEEDAEDQIRKSMEARGKQENLSFFAFTATPKAKTIQVFGTPDVDGKPKPFHLYSMKQAIQEGFILDVLQNYRTYKSFFALSKKIEDDPKINKKQASRAIARFLSLHPHNLAQKTEVIIEHFRQVVSKEIGGKAKAMVVTGSRLHAVRYKEEFDKYIKENGYSNIKTLVAFSGKVTYGAYPDGVTESELNGFKEKELPKKFASGEYQLLIVADKYQTGFDQPLLHTMYVDKKLRGVKCVQTLSRLNRMHAGKENTFVLDFANEAEDIRESFQPYYEMTTVEEITDPNYLYELKWEIEKARIIWDSEVDNFCNVFFKSPKKLTVREQGKLNSYIDPAVDRFRQLPEEANAGDIVHEFTQESFKNSLQAFTRLYAFLTQIMPFTDVDLEKLFTYSKYLLKKLPRKHQSDRFQLGDEVALEYYRLQKISEQHLALEDEHEYGLDGSISSGIRLGKDEDEALSEIIKLLNNRFGTDFTSGDKLFLDQVVEDSLQNEKIKLQAESNSLDNFLYAFNDVAMDLVIDRMDMNKEFFARIIDNKELTSVVFKYMAEKVYNQANGR